MTKLLLFTRLLLIISLFTNLFAHAQTVNTDYATQINSTFANLDKTKIPHKLLVDYAMEFEELSSYNGTLTSNNVTNIGNYNGIYNTLLMSRVQSNVPGLINPTTFKNNWNTLRQANKIVLSGLYYKYNEFKPDAPNNTITINNGKLYDKYVNGIWQNPYDEKQVFAISAPIVKYNSLIMRVQLPASLWYTNQSSNIQSLAIDFNDGLGYQITTFGQLKTVRYATPGLKEWKYKLTLTNNQILYSHSKIFIDAEIPSTRDTPVTRASTQPCSPDAFGVDKVNFSGTRQYLGTANQAILEIDYALNDCIIRKPLIIVEGFDSGLLGVENDLGDVSYLDFKRSASIFLSGSINLPSQLNTYDIIYINFKNGRDYMQRNALLVQDIIKLVNSRKEGTQPNVVLGQSMGGVIARYALRDMENQLASTGNQSWNHQANLYISHDAPHQGANIPVAIQYFARHLADQFISTPLGDMNINVTGNGGAVSIEDLQNLLDAPGTKQLLANYINSGFSLNNNVGDTFRAELQNMGYPQQTRNIALSNGNHCAIPQNFNPGDNLFSLTGGGQTKLLTDLALSLTPLGGLSSITLAILFNEPGLLIGMLPGNSKFDLNFNGRALPTAGTTSQIYNGRISFTKTLFKLFGWTPRITVTLTDEEFNNPVNLSYDYYPGGKYDSFISSGNTSGVFPLLASYGINMQARENFNFIATPSALDVGIGNVPLNNSDYFIKYNALTPPLAPKLIPFDNFTTSHNTTGTNESHISFNTRNGNWLATELDSNTNYDVFDCTFICANTQISGNDKLCNTATYSVPTGGTTFNWTITQGSNLVTLTGNGTANITLTALPGVSGQITISCTTGNAKCGYTTMPPKDIWVGLPEIYEFTSGIEQAYPSCIIGFDCFSTTLESSVISASFEGMSTAERDNPANWEWSRGNNLITLNTYGKDVVVCPRAAGVSSFKVRAKNSCGWSDWVDYGSFVISNCYNNLNISTNTYTVYPNPSNADVNIDLRDQNNKPQEGAVISGELFDLIGMSKSLVTISNNRATFSVANLSQGIYILKIYIDGQVETHQVAVE